MVSFDKNSSISQLANKQFLSFLKEQNARKTPERIAVLNEVYKMSGHFEVDQLHAKIKQQLPNISLATVYNTLELLLKANLVMKLNFGDNRFCYEKALGVKQHNHLKCNQCGELIEFCDPGIQQIKNQMGELLSFNVTHHTLILHGDCCKQECPNRENRASG